MVIPSWLLVRDGNTVMVTGKRCRMPSLTFIDLSYHMLTFEGDMSRSMVDTLLEFVPNS